MSESDESGLPELSVHFPLEGAARIERRLGGDAEEDAHRLGQWIFRPSRDRVVTARLLALLAALADADAEAEERW